MIEWIEKNRKLISVPSGVPVVAIAAGVNHALGLRSDGSLIGWRSNDHGQTNVPIGTKFIAVSAGGQFSLALTTDGRIVA